MYMCNRRVAAAVCHCSGEANGTAYVQFETAAMAKDAFERYNDVALDGKPMKIAFDSGSTRKLASGITYVSSICEQSSTLVQACHPILCV